MAEIVFQDDDDFLVLFLDAVEREEHRISATATKHPVSQGVKFSDHLDPNSDPVVLDVVFTDTPTNDETRVLTRRVDAWAQLLDARDRALPAIVTTDVRTYDDCVLVEASTSITKADGTWLRARLVFEPIRQVTTELVADPTPDRDRREVNEGSVATQEAPEEIVSLLSSGVLG